MSHQGNDELIDNKRDELELEEKIRSHPKFQLLVKVAKLCKEHPEVKLADIIKELGEMR